MLNSLISTTLILVTYLRVAVLLNPEAGTDRMDLVDDTTNVTIEAVNLSEDMSTMSSQNDEVIVFIYDFSDTSKLSNPLAAEYFVLDSAHRTKKFTITGANRKNRLLFFLVEQDTEKPISQVEGIFRKHYRNILKLVEQKDRVALEKLTGTNDLMGLKVIENFDSGPKHIPFSFIGRFKLDKFYYKVSIDK